VRKLLVLLLMVGIAFDVRAPSAAEQDRPLIVFAAASLTDAVTEVSAAFTRETGIAVKTSFAASSVLARQIEAGAPATVFFAADEQWMDYLQTRNLLAPGSRKDVLANQLVLVAPADSTVTVKITSGPALVQALGGARIATGDPDSVPVGKYAKAALIKLGVWDQLQGRLVRAEDVRSALAFVARGDAPFGIVYLTDAKVEKRVKLLDVFPQDAYPPIRYPIAMTAGAGADAGRFIDFATGKRAAAIFQTYGFALTGMGEAPSTAAADPCTGFTWDISRERTVMKQTPRAVAGAVRPGADVPRIEPERLYEVKLADQSTVTFVAMPGKAALTDGAHAGLVRFRVEKAGRYRVSITSRHWIDVVDGTQLVSSRDFQGQRGCERPHKIVEYELPAGRDLTLQFSGSADAQVIVAITAVSTTTIPTADVRQATDAHTRPRVDAESSSR
jgi:molybdate transport system substrate-binding protein